MAAQVLSWCSRPLSVVTAAVLVLASAVGLAHPAYADPPTPVVTQSIVGLPASGAAAVPNVIFDGVSCGAAGSCVAVGQYQDAQGHPAGLIETLSGGAWTGTRAPLPADAGTSPNPQVLMVACGAAGSCAAVELYSAESAPYTRYALLSLAGGSWTAVDFPTLAGTAPVPTGMGCDAANSCTLVGTYTGTDGHQRGFVAMFHSGWTVVDGPLPVDAITPSSGAVTLSRLNAVSCSSTRCLAVGEYQQSTGLYDLLVDAITPAAGTVNADPKPAVPADDDHGTDFAGISCTRAGPCAAYGQYFDSGNVAHELLEPLGDNWVHGWSPQVVPTLVPTPPNTGLPVTAVACASGASEDGCVLAGDYTNTSFQPQILTDRLAGGSWTADTPPSGLVMGAASCGSPTYCVEAFTQNPHADALDVLSGTTWTTATTPDPVGNGYYPTLEAIACDAPDSCWVLGRGYQEEGVAEHVTPTSPPPTVTVTTPTPPFTLGASTQVSWHATAGGAPITHYAVQERKAPWNGGFGAWTTPSAWSNLPSSTTHVAAALAVGADTCVRVEAFDSGGGSAYSNQRCTARPLDDKSLAASSGWKRVAKSGYYLGTYSTTTHLHATSSRSGAQLDRVALVATTCPTCGRVGVYAGGTLLGTVDLHSASTHRQVVTLLPPISQRTATVTVKVLTSGKVVEVDGLGVSRS